MSDDLIVTVADLRAALDLLLTEAERRPGQTIDLDVDYYWDLDPSVIYDLRQAPTGEPAAGPLSDDVESIRRLLERGPDGEVILWHDLADVVGVLRRVAALDRPTTS